MAITDMGEMTRTAWADRTTETVADRRWVLYAMLVMLNVIDVISTVAVLDAGGEEGNPFVRPLIEGVWPAVVAKAAVLGIIAVLLQRCGPTLSRATQVALVGATGWYLAVVAWNTVVLVTI